MGGSWDMTAVVAGTGSRDGLASRLTNGAIIAGQAWVRIICIDKEAFSAQVLRRGEPGCGSREGAFSA
jgi:hypothetical protein